MEQDESPVNIETSFRVRFGERFLKALVECEDLDGDSIRVSSVLAQMHASTTSGIPHLVEGFVEELFQQEWIDVDGPEQTEVGQRRIKLTVLGHAEVQMSHYDPSAE